MNSTAQVIDKAPIIAAAKRDARVRGFRDLAGRRFGRLTAIEPTGEKAIDGCNMWLCRCDCGNTTVVRSNKLLQGRTLSCGCYGRERLRNSRTFVGGTCLEIVSSHAIYANNTSGVKGVSRSRGQWMAKISFARNQIFLGRFDEFRTAVEVINEAERIREEIIRDIDVLGDDASGEFSRRMTELKDEYAQYRHSRGAKRAAAR